MDTIYCAPTREKEWGGSEERFLRTRRGEAEGSHTFEMKGRASPVPVGSGQRQNQPKSGKEEKRKRGRNILRPYKGQRGIRRRGRLDAGDSGRILLEENASPINWNASRMITVLSPAGLGSYPGDSKF